jgi:hypothetical protein
MFTYKKSAIENTYAITNIDKTYDYVKTIKIEQEGFFKLLIQFGGTTLNVQHSCDCIKTFPIDNN